VFKKKDRIGVVGKNGVGKSTFLDLLTGNLKPDKGEVIRGVTTKFGYFTQETITLNPANRLIEEVKEIAEFITLADGTQVSASKFLDNFLFPPEKQYNYISKLSGGEKKRLQLLKLLVTNPNFLILDEPTNDFDIDTLNVLEDYLDNFSGCLLLVSHDRYFMDHLVDQLFVFEGDGRIRLFNGNYTDYRDWLDEEELTKSNQKPQQPPVVREETPPKNADKKKASFKEKQEYEKLQSEIEALERRKADITLQFSNGTTDHNQLQQLSKEVKNISDQIDEKTLRWLELAELIN
jgi:ATP-binding cassette subfamily F protein uup